MAYNFLHYNAYLEYKSLFDLLFLILNFIDNAIKVGLVKISKELRLAT